MAIGFVLMVAACGITLRIGSSAQKRAAVLIFLCYLGAGIASAHSKHRIEPLIGGDIVYGFGVLWLAWRYNERWLWIAIAVQAVFFSLHVWLYESGATPSTAYIIINNALAALTLVVLVGAAIAAARKRRRI
jgi:hypothetical protein